MLKRDIKFLDFDDEEQVEEHYFNLSKAELIEIETDVPGGLSTILKQIVASRDPGALIKEFKRLILLAYGKKSPDGKRFEKSDEIRKEFEQTAAYQSLFMELATEDGKAIEFLRGVMPPDMREGFDTAIAEEDAKTKNAATPNP